MKPELEGLQVVYPPSFFDKEKIEIAIEAGDEHIIILRRFGEKPHYNTHYTSHARRFTD